MIAIRPAADGDREAVRALLDVEHRHYFGDPLPVAAQERALDDLFGAPGCTMLLAEAGDALVGIATYVVLQPSTNGYGTLFLKDLYVDGSQRGAGIGRRLMGALAQIAADRGCSRFDWTTERDNPGAMALYDRLGAARVDEKVYYRVRREDLEAFAQTCNS